MITQLYGMVSILVSEEAFQHLKRISRQPFIVRLIIFFDMIQPSGNKSTEVVEYGDDRSYFLILLGAHLA
jgi:hypothetical protein